MARLILGLAKDGPETDHRDRNGLNNRRSNLRIANDKDQSGNKDKFSRGGKSASKYKGVNLHSGKWRAVITPNKKHIYLGSFASEVDAARAYDRAAVEYFGEFARTNFTG